MSKPIGIMSPSLALGLSVWRHSTQERADDGCSRSPPSVTLPPNFRPSYLQQAAFTQIGQAPVASDDPRHCVLDDPFALDF